MKALRLGNNCLLCGMIQKMLTRLFKIGLSSFGLVVFMASALVAQPRPVAKAPPNNASPIIRQNFSNIARQTMPSVVSVRSSNPQLRANTHLFENSDGLAATGSGFFIDNRGHIITNNHVIEMGQSFLITLQNGVSYPATLLGRDEETDIAVLKVNSNNAFPFVNLADSDKVEIGDWAIAIGSPYGLGNSFSVGVVSGRNRDLQSGRFDNFIQTDAAINHGNSGGPLFNDQGQVIGVNTAIVSGEAGGGSVGIGFAVPSNVVRRISADIIQYGYVRRGWVGFRARPARANEGAGVVITAIAPNSPAARAGLRAGDRIFMARNINISDPRQLARLIADSQIASNVRVDGFRGNRRIFAVLNIALPPSLAAQNPSSSIVATRSMGINMRVPNASEKARYGQDVKVIVSAIDPFGPARGKINPGDILLEVQGRAISDPAQARALMDEAARARGNVIVKFKRGPNIFFETLNGRN